MLINILLFILGFIFLIKGADLLVKGASALAKKIGVADFIIGLTVLAIGTSLPEMVISLTASLKADSDLLIGNLLGSDITNILLILGTAALIRPLTLKQRTIRWELPALFLSVCLAAWLLNDFYSGQFHGLSFGDGLILIAVFFVFMLYVFSTSRHDVDYKHKISKRDYHWGKATLMIFIGLIGLIIGANGVVAGATFLTEWFGWQSSVIGLSVIALGTSLPELATSLVATYRRKPDLAVANIIGANFINLTLTLGLSSLLRPVVFTPSLNADIIVLLLAIISLFGLSLIGRKFTINRWQGGSLVFLYLVYLVYLFYRI